jgi:hypothetical protein
MHRNSTGQRNGDRSYYYIPENQRKTLLFSSYALSVFMDRKDGTPDVCIIMAAKLVGGGMTS